MRQMEKLGCILITAMLLTGSGGCIWWGEAGEAENRPYSDRLIFSADGKRAAYVWTDRFRSLIPYPPYMPMDTLAEAKAELAGWCNPDGSNHMVRIDERRRFGGGFGNSRSIIGLEFSPDGAYLATTLADRIEIIDTAFGKTHRIDPPTGKFSSMHWIGSDQIVYATCTKTFFGNRNCVRKSIFRQKVTDPASRVELFSEVSDLHCYEALQESWSPDGKAVIITEWTSVRWLDTESGKLTSLVRLPDSDIAFGMFGQVCWHVCWRPDGASVVCKGNWESNGNLLRAVLVDCRNLQVTDLTDDFCRDTGKNWVSITSWTPDGYLLTKSLLPGQWMAYLVQPKPWRIIHFQKNYGKELPRNGNGRTVVQPLRRGWLAVGPGEKDPNMYAVDYQGKRVIPITKHPFMISPEGSQIAEVVGKGKVVIRKLNLPD